MPTEPDSEAPESLSVAELADLLLAAEAEGRELTPLTDRWAGLDLATAYAVQDAALDRRLQRGERLSGAKLGLTSVAKQRTMKVDEPVVAWLTDRMARPAGRGVAATEFIHPRVEPEIAVLLAQPLRGPDVTAEEARAAIGSVMAAVELIDSRYQDFRFRAPDVVADNASAGAYWLGERRLPVAEVDLARLPVAIRAGGRTLATATSEAVLGDPAEALALAANVLAARGRHLSAGQVVLTGAMTDAVPLTEHPQIEFDFGELGLISIESEVRHAAD